MKTIIAILFMLPYCAFAQNGLAPTELYSLRYLGRDGNGTNYQVLIRTQTNAVPVLTVETASKLVAISNLQYDVTYYLSVKAQSNGVWSAESTNYVWPHPREDYFSVQSYSMPSLGGTKHWLSGTVKTFTNLPGPSMFVGVAAWSSNNITPYIYPQ